MRQTGDTHTHIIQSYSELMRTRSTKKQDKMEERFEQSTSSLLKYIWENSLEWQLKCKSVLNIKNINSIAK